MTRYVVWAVIPETSAEPEVLQDETGLLPTTAEVVRFVTVQEAAFTSGLDHVSLTKVLLSLMRLGVAAAVKGPAPEQEPPLLLTATDGQLLQPVLEALTRMT